MKIKQRLRLPSFAKFIGGQFSRSSADRVIPFLTRNFTQEFFGRVIKGRLIQSADRSKGRFRSLLLKALQRFLHDEGDKRHARKRGGDLRFRFVGTTG